MIVEWYSQFGNTVGPVFGFGHGKRQTGEEGGGVYNVDGKACIV